MEFSLPKSVSALPIPDPSVPLWKQLYERKKTLKKKQADFDNADLAMILPIPVPPGCAESAVEFINLAAYPHFFSDMKDLFQEVVQNPTPFGGKLARGKGFEALKVHNVGAF